ncbi:MAG: hypothetical protein K8S97_12675 [Anaerolineae bacterium]|nr:hypothetical protein [Anaerolineae bacterium]
MTHSFQIDTDKLQAIIDHFNAQAACAEALVTRLEQQLEALRSTAWRGPDAERILARVEDDLLPRVVKLREGMIGAGAALSEFLERMIGIGPALEQLHTGMPKIEAARDKLKAHIKKLQNQDPDEMKRAFQKFLREQGHDDAADQLDHLTF